MSYSSKIAKVTFIVGAGAFIGGALRYVITASTKKVKKFPLGTFLCNIIGCFFVGFISRISSSKASHYILNFATTGIMGGLTTFSTYANESNNFLISGNNGICKACGMFFLNLFANLLIGFLFDYLGYKIAGWAKLDE